MKRLFLIGALVGARALTAHSQTISAMTEQLIELKLLEQTTATGYVTMTSGVDSIGQITADAYYLDYLNIYVWQNYFYY